MQCVIDYFKQIVVYFVKVVADVPTLLLSIPRDLVTEFECITLESSLSV